MLKTLAVALVLAVTGHAHSQPQFMNIHGAHWTIPGEQHSGVDILTGIGTPVLAARAGQVIWLEDRFDAQWLHPNILIRHTGSVDIHYYHIDRLQVQLGDHVQQGQVIAYTARTGKRLPHEPGVFPGRPHLHMETRDPSGRKFDPLTLPFTCPRLGGDWWWPVGC
jgi:murein DD-endopeptidase MepM/ murein hydrolase activator NlpD